jgi:PII-like signaling protein
LNSTGFGKAVLAACFGLRPEGSLLDEHTWSISQELPVIVEVADEAARIRDVPLVIEIVDAEEKVDAFLPAVDELVTEGLVTLEAVRILRYVSRDSR